MTRVCSAILQLHHITNNKFQSGSQQVLVHHKILEPITFWYANWPCTTAINQKICMWSLTLWQNCATAASRISAPDRTGSEIQNHSKRENRYKPFHVHRRVCHQQRALTPCLLHPTDTWGSPPTHHTCYSEILLALIHIHLRTELSADRRRHAALAADKIGQSDREGGKTRGKEGTAGGKQSMTIIDEERKRERERGWGYRFKELTKLWFYHRYSKCWIFYKMLQ